MIAPFVQAGAADDAPLLCIPAQHVAQHSVPAATRTGFTPTVISEGREAYIRGFAQCKDALRGGGVEKVVFSRRLTLHLGRKGSMDDVQALFFAACRRYPQSYVALWHTAGSGTWLVATPERLLSGARDGTWHTMALAGTRSLDECSTQPSWDAKNCAEQGIVVSYIRERLSPLCSRVNVGETYTREAGGVAHLCTDFALIPRSGVSPLQLVEALHPTPAVCGKPTSAAQQLICAVEESPRRYFSGFSGPLNVHGETHFFVTLRCMHISQQTATLYAGGGLLAASKLESEWQETERKLATMRCLL